MRLFVVLLVFLHVLGRPFPGNPKSFFPKISNGDEDLSLHQINERIRIIDLFNAIGICCDQRQFQMILDEVFTEQVMFLGDMSRCEDGGGKNPPQPVQMNATEIVDGWRQFLANYAMTQHMLTNHMIRFEEEDKAVGFAYGDVYRTSANRINNKTEAGIIAGYYSHHFVKLKGRWKIDGFQFFCTFLHEPL